MASFIKMSDAANLALHASALLASAPERRVPAKEMARRPRRISRRSCSA